MKHAAADRLGEGSLGLGYGSCHHCVGYHRMDIGLVGGSDLAGDHRNKTWRMMILSDNDIRDLKGRQVNLGDLGDLGYSKQAGGTLTINTSTTEPRVAERDGRDGSTAS